MIIKNFLLFSSVGPNSKYGVHGYDNKEKKMRAIFFAQGPLINSGHSLKPFDNVELYSLFCIVLKLQCRRRDGSGRLDNWNVLLKNRVRNRNHRQNAQKQPHHRHRGHNQNNRG